MTATIRMSGDEAACRRYYLIYLVLDASISMRVDLETRKLNPNGTLRGTQLGQFTNLIPPMLRRLSEHSVVNTLASISVVAFNDTVQVLRPMSGLSRPGAIRTPPDGHATDYAAVLRFIARRHAADVRAVMKERQRPDEQVVTARPWIYFITDGRPFANHAQQQFKVWLPYRDALVTAPIGARIVTLGLHRAEREVLWRLSTGTDDGVRNALIAEPDADPYSLADSIVNSISRSISASLTSAAKGGNLLIDVPDGMERIDPEASWATRRW